MNKKIIIIIAAVLILAIIGGVVAFMLLRTPEEKPIVYFEFPLDEEYSNLADEGGNKIVKYIVIIEYTNEEILESLTKNKTKIRNNIDEIMRSTYSEDIAKVNGKQRLREKIQNMVIEVLESDEEVITNIYIQPFVVQG